MQRMATIVGGSDIYLMDLTGMTIAANNFGQPDTFVGNNYAFRPYFSEAVATGESVAYFALGKISSERGLYFTHPVRDQRGNMLRSEEHTSELQSRPHLVCRLLLEKKK